jgi:hypothetical protein
MAYAPAADAAKASSVRVIPQILIRVSMSNSQLARAEMAENSSKFQGLLALTFVVAAETLSRLLKNSLLIQAMDGLVANQSRK